MTAKSNVADACGACGQSTMTPHGRKGGLRCETCGHEQTISLFIKGFLTEQYENGYRPDMSEPRSTLPETDGGSMKIVTGFLAAEDRHGIPLHADDGC